MKRFKRPSTAPSRSILSSPNSSYHIFLISNPADSEDPNYLPAIVNSYEGQLNEMSSNTNPGGNVANTGNDNGASNATSTETKYTEQQRADRAEVTKALADKTTIETMDRWGNSSKERRKKNVGMP